MEHSWTVAPDFSGHLMISDGGSHACHSLGVLFSEKKRKFLGTS